MSARTCSRVALSSEDKRRLWSESGGYCQNPSCGRYLFAEGSDVNFAEMAHIIPASTGGPRDVPVEELPARERARHENIVVLCATCHTIVDKDPTSYHAGLMREWKQRHQDALERAFGTPTYASRPEARARIVPLLGTNRLVHRNYGPTPGEFSDTTSAQWRRHVRTTILPNNREIVRVLEVNRHLLTPDELDTLEEFALHVRELEYRHLLNDWTAGSSRFPEGVSSILKDEA
jgi:hypothetical protein